MLNVAVIMGRLTADPEVRHTTGGVSVTSFTVACERSYSNPKDGNRETDFIDCVAWRNTADFIGKYFSKGQMIVVQGEIQTRNYEDKNGSKRKAVELIANNVNFGESKKQDNGMDQIANKAKNMGIAVEFEDASTDDDLPFD